MPVPVIAERNAGQDRLNLRTPEPYSVGNAGAVGDGLADDYNALFEASRKQGTSGAIFLPPGTYAVGTSLTIACQVIFAFGAKLKPRTGVTVTLTGPVTTAPGDGIIAIGTGGTVTVTGPLNASGVIDVRTFGAKGDGVTDDTAAIQRALDAAEAAGGGIVFAPEGTYGFTQLNIRASVTLCGVGRGATTLQRLSNGQNVIGSDGLFGVRLRGNFASLCDLSVRGRWNPANPTTQTFDCNIVVMDTDTSHTLVRNVETYNAHIGYLIGGLIGNAASYGGQNYNGVVDCYAHDTYDLGFGFVAKDRTASGTNRGCFLTNCRASNSYATGGLEVRFQSGTQVTGLYVTDCANQNLGVGIRLEEVNDCVVQGLHTERCGFGIQAINDSYECVISGFISREDQYGAFFGNCADMRLDGFAIKSTTRDGISLAPIAGAAWTRNNERITIQNGLIDTTGTAFTGYGIEIFGTLATADAARVTNGTDLKVIGVTVKNTPNHGILVQAGGRFQILDCTVIDCGGGSLNNAGILVLYPTVNSVNDTGHPLNGIIDNITFVTTGNMPRPYLDANGLVYQGRFRFVGSFSALPTLQTANDLNTRFVVRYNANEAAGIHLMQTTPVLPSPRLFLGNVTDGTGAVLRGNANTLEMRLGVTPDGSAGSGTAAAILHSNRLELQSGVRLAVSGTDAAVYAGSGTPEGVVTAVVGSLFLRTDGGAGSTLYIKETGTSNTGWVAK